MKVLTYRILLQEPTLVSALGGDPNGDTALAYLPGSVLRGAVIARYLQQRRQGTPGYQLDAADAETRRLFFDGTTRYLNGYLVAEGVRSLPLPLSWHRAKGEEESLTDFALADPDLAKQWQGAPWPFCVLLGEQSVRLLKPKRHISAHTARNRRLGRAQEPGRGPEGEDPGAVYRYDALAPGQTFAAAVVCDRHEDLAGLLPLLDGPAALGGSRSGGYGRAVLHSTAEAAAEWREAGTAAGTTPGTVRITLLSDALVRNESGQFVVDGHAVGRVVAARLGLPDLQPRRQFARATTVGGFNRKWGLPLPQTPAVAMGSVFVFDLPGAGEEQLRRLEDQGIGERRAEGFGRVAVNWDTAPQLTVEKEPPREEVRPVAVPAGTASGSLALRMAERMLRQRLDAGVAARATVLGSKVTRPSKSQLSRLRLVLHDALRQPPGAGRQRLLAYVNDLDGRQATRQQFARNRVENRSLLDWLRFRIADGEDIWHSLKVSSRPEVGGIKPDLTAELAYEYNLRLIDAVLARAAKERRKEDR